MSKLKANKLKRGHKSSDRFEKGNEVETEFLGVLKVVQ
jgi:hypothetical protein